ncbi:cytochrome bd oxidase small subunit, CydX/CbdX family [Mergibacter septicus]|uniref:Cytochrome bd oxidase small subunit, CydX/CbdX family n=1 Tax=Mergibacter septicus TaxID=221402 RepID=A0A8E3MFM8_9PAST|nr:CydX/CbdX family cytochrome bd oxidase small subunit [Mergibacter septicus]AWX13153.1 cytochrome bd oxidase small subunit, CydX/CbdX family [Mergibacter septicus]AWX15055.1 cytochrome bd oxidase small subunit, CydX/CbdX family [Mergibacter septicus]QDJ12573.1 cytochrome bd oxidase small subunit, CydX/CbdX family [Mergibacter septicus]QDJ14308.1 cytochrome bd oxidase small subunit, CydX/CbdX family [Mergibacter septicus]UTU48251.1 cytochrome bd oxidase small subunit, CydX/CbdX family [Mergib
MFYVTWILGVMFAVFLAAIITISIEKTGKFDE